MRGSAPSLPRYFDSLWRVDAYQEYVVVEIYELDHLLHAPVDLGAYKAAESAPRHGRRGLYSRPTSIWPSSLSERATLPERARSLRRLYLWKRSNIWWSVNTQVFVLWSTKPSCTVDITGVNTMPLSPRSAKYGAQTLYLLLAVGEHIYGVAVGNEAREGVGNKVEVLMIYPLGSAAETYHRCIGGIAVGSDVGGRSETHLPHGRNRRGERVGVDNLPESVGVAFLGNRGTGAESVGGHGAYSLKGKPHRAPRQSCQGLRSRANDTDDDAARGETSAVTEISESERSDSWVSMLNVRIVSISSPKSRCETAAPSCSRICRG